jgi:hypothetical protein
MGRGRGRGTFTAIKLFSRLLAYSGILEVWAKIGRLILLEMQSMIIRPFTMYSFLARFHRSN